ncbi:MAG: hypothetical protein H0W76_09895 [Pyrinomonadaceae bacterium]|nr:hypothetical protein [Pyrinomonadaceae bacterium]
MRQVESIVKQQQQPIRHVVGKVGTATSTTTTPLSGSHNTLFTLPLQLLKGLLDLRQECLKLM